jgi:hypothetical protein
VTLHQGEEADVVVPEEEEDQCVEAEEVVIGVVAVETQEELLTQEDLPVVEVVGVVAPEATVEASTAAMTAILWSAVAPKAP